MSDNDWLKTSLDRIENKVDKIDLRVDSLDVTAVRQQAILEEHQKRSLANEAAVQVIASELKPVKEHVLKVNFIIKVILWTIASAGAIEFFVHKLVTTF